MTRAALLLAAPLVLALAACGHHKDSEVTITTSDDGKTTTTTTTTKGNAASTETSSVELKLPGGFEAKVKAPRMFGDMTHIDIDGVGLYPGAHIGAVNINAGAADSDGDSDEKGKHDATVGIGFTSADAPGKVADWYATQFAAKGRTVTRSGDTISGKTKDNGDFSIALTPGGAGGAKGQITIKSS